MAGFVVAAAALGLAVSPAVAAASRPTHHAQPLRNQQGCGSRCESSARRLPPTLGTKKVFSGHGVGWGAVKPSVLSNDTDCQGAIGSIHWSSWGGKSAIGMGTTCLDGGAQTVTIKLEPTALRTCPGTHRLAYTRFVVQYADKHGRYGKKQIWYGLKNMCVKSNRVTYYSRF